MKLIKAFFYLLIFLVLQVIDVCAQDPVLRLFSVEDGLPGGAVYSTLQDRDGYIWSATERGLTRFDGNEFKLFTVKEGLPSNDVWRLTEDAGGKLWLGTFLKVSYIEDGQVKVLNSELLEKEKGKFKHVLTPIGHLLYFNTSMKAYLIADNDSLSLAVDNINSHRINEQLYLRENHQTTFLFKEIRKRLKVPDGDSMVLFDQSLIIDKGRVVENFLLQNSAKISAIQSLSSNQVFIVVSGNLWLFDQTGFQKITLNHIFGNKKNEKILLAQKIAPNRIWLKTDIGNYVIDSSFQWVPEFDFLNNYSINSILIDRQQNLWISTNDGLYFINKKAFLSKTYTINSKIGTESIKYLAVNKNQEIWGLSGRGNLYQLDYVTGLNKVDNFPQVDGPKDIAFDPDGNLWVGGGYLYEAKAKGLSEGQQGGAIRKFRDVNWRAIKRIVFHENGTALISNSRYTSLFLDVDKEKESRFFGRYYGLALTGNGSFWISGKTGVHHVDRNGQEISIPQRKEFHVFDLPTDNIVLDQEERLWIGVNNKGVYRYDGQKLDSIIELNDILIQSLQVDQYNRLWASTNVGLAKVSNFQSSPFEYDFQWLTEIDGLISNDVKEIVIDQENIVIATEKGVSVLKDIAENEIQAIAPFHFSNLKINGKDTTVHQSYVLRHTQNSLLIEYQCLDFKNLGHLVFQYKMEGVDEKWIDTRSFQKEYPLLPPGAYTFLLRRKPKSSSNATPELRMHFVIKEPFWKRTWVLVTLFMMAGLLTLWIIQLRIRSVKKRAAEEIAIKQKIAELELQALQAQMNPHFVFNALHAIQDYIFKKDERVANRYLVKFSRLMRLFLESSKEKFILLEDEIQLLSLYIELEKIRFEDKFDFEINIGDDLSSGTIEIPSMLLQPFVENAINHGLIQRKESGKLLLSFTKENGTLHCRIEDNGIGRKKATEIKNQSIKSYKSRGMQLVEERQKIWNQIGNAAIDIVVEDLYNEDKVGIGTRIDVFINLGE